MPVNVPNILIKFAESLEADIINNQIEIPEKFGTGYCRGYVFNQHMRMLISNYELKDDLMITNPDVNNGGRMIFFKFQHIFPKTTKASTERSQVETPSVLIATSRINVDEVIAIHTNTATINIEVDAAYLSGLFDMPDNSPVLQSLLLNMQPLLFEQVIHPALQQIVNDIVNEHTGKTFELLFLRIKAEELVCRLLMELEKREGRSFYSLNRHDIQTIYKVREQMLQQLAVAPVINTLAANAGMSPTKLKRLFSQIFGNSIFNYYQQHRIKEAARLLKEEHLNVSAIGYKLGFTNLSHFSKMFKEHIGMKPKEYSRMKS